MTTTFSPLLALTARDLMTRDVTLLSEHMPLRVAAELLLQYRIGGAPVVDEEGRCIGVLSAIDFLRLAERRDNIKDIAAGPLPLTCSFQTKKKLPDGRQLTLCTLAPGACPIQRPTKDAEGTEQIICTQPHCVLADWQLVQIEKLPNDEVGQYMTPDPVTVRPETSIRELARKMIDTHIHRIIVVDNERRPMGVVSTTDVLAAVAYVEDDLSR